MTRSIPWLVYKPTGRIRLTKRCFGGVGVQAEYNAARLTSPPPPGSTSEPVWSRTEWRDLRWKDVESEWAYTPLVAYS